MNITNALEIADMYVTRAAAAPTPELLSLLYRSSLNSIHAMYAAGLLSAAENEECLKRFVDTCQRRQIEITGVRP
ncbi:hypothetical protein [Pseudomonas sp. WS 5011]|uniref:hypothetical protein n=1 Tax=Pseudomonas sp. WS 5011 TaxID=2717477 RepID=UPI00147351CD|nr:hypothetical protein [Pseudomonas sp. WS 5011]NMY53226.1 hypothetical protein [Pseudomonas sp. WS 5011]